jgi:hypothetical protein
MEVAVRNLTRESERFALRARLYRSAVRPLAEPRKLCARDVFRRQLYRRLAVIACGDHIAR